MRLSFLNKKNILLLLPLLSLSAVGRAQMTVASTAGTVKRTPAKKPKPITKEFSVGARLTSDGYGLYAEKSIVNSNNLKTQDMFYNTRFFQVGFEEHKHAKETKREFVDQSGSGNKSKPFVFGKVNNFYTLKLGYGFRKMIAGKPEPGTVSIHWTGVAGLAAGLLKPYYLEENVPEGAGYVQKSVKYTEETKSYFLNPYYIIGASGVTKGIGEVQFVPGIHAGTALHFDFAPSKKHVLAVETGVTGEYYTKNIMILANQEAKPYFVNLYAALQLGWRK